MANELDSFIREGFTAFPEAYQAVDEFTKSLDLQVKGFLKELGNGPEFRVDIDRVRLPYKSGDARDGYCIQWGVPATCQRGAVKVYVGYWWRPGRLEEHFLIAWGNDADPRSFSGYKPLNPDLKVGKVNYAWNGDRLYLPLDPTAAGGGEIRMLLEELIHWLNTEKPAAE